MTASGKVTFLGGNQTRPLMKPLNLRHPAVKQCLLWCSFRLVIAANAQIGSDGGGASASWLRPQPAICNAIITAEKYCHGSLTATPGTGHLSWMAL